MLKSRFIRLAQVSLAVVATGMAVNASAQSTKGVINAGTITTFPPFESKDPATDTLVGFDIDIGKALVEKTGAKINWVESSFDQLISFSSLKTKRNDIIISAITDLPERRANVDFVDYVKDGTVFYTLKTNASKFPNMEALCGTNVAVTRSSSRWVSAVETWSDEHCVKAGKSPLKVLSADNSAQAQLQLDQGRADAAIMGGPSLAYQNSLRGGRYMTIGKSILTNTYGIAIAKDNPELTQSIKKALNAMIADGSYQAVLKKWNMPADSAVTEAAINGQP